MKYKKVIVGISGVLLIGAGAYMYLQYGQGINMPNLGTLIETGQALSDKQETGDVETEEQVESGVIEGEEIVELSESELHEIFEEAYLESVWSMRNYLGVSKASILRSEYDRIEKLCPIGKELPADYKDQYKVWREEYRVGDMRYIFTDEEAKQYYVKESSYTYTNIYDEAKVESLIANEVVKVTGIGYDKGEGWLRVETSTGVGYVEASKLEEKKGDGFFKVSKTMYAIEAVNIRVAPNKEAEKVDSLSIGESVHVIGIGQWDVSGWSKIQIGDKVYYVRSEYLSDEKPVTNTGGNTSGSNQNNNGGNQSGGNNGSGNNGGDSGNTSNGSGGSNSNGGDYGEYDDPYEYTPPQYDEETQDAIDRENEEDSGLVGSG